jgi:transcriptional regulator with XRE-family HTH domain
MSTIETAAVAEAIGRRIRAEREARGWSQERLGRETGLSRETIRRAEQGQAIPGGTTLNAIAVAFGLTLSGLLDFEPLGRYRGEREPALSGRAA